MASASTITPAKIVHVHELPLLKVGDEKVFVRVLGKYVWGMVCFLMLRLVDIESL